MRRLYQADDHSRDEATQVETQGDEHILPRQILTLADEIVHRLQDQGNTMHHHRMHHSHSAHLHSSSKTTQTSREQSA